MPLIAALDITIDADLTAPDRVPLFVFLAMLVSFLFIRTSARLMRSPKVPWWPGSITSGDLHIHHLVWGIVLVLLAGFLSFALDLESPWIEIAAVAFGIGAGLTIDEYALWLHLDDVYWAEEGRKSVDAAVIAVVFAGLVITVSPFSQAEGAGAAVVLFVLYRLFVVAIALAKGKYLMGLVGFFIPLMAEVGAIRLARPESIWARRRYPPEGDKLRKAGERETVLDQRRQRLRDLVGGAPSRLLHGPAHDSEGAPTAESTEPKPPAER